MCVEENVIMLCFQQSIILSFSNAIFTVHRVEHGYINTAFKMIIFGVHFHKHPTSASFTLLINQNVARVCHTESLDTVKK